MMKIGDIKINTNHAGSLMLLLIFLLAGNFSYAQTESNDVVEAIVAKVGDEFVLLSEFNERVAYQDELKGGLSSEQKCAAIEGLLMQKLLIHQARIDSVVVSDDAVEAKLDENITHILRLMNNDEERFKEEYGKSVADVRKQFREDIRERMTAQRMQMTILESTKIIPSDVQEFYNSIPKDSLPFFNSEVELGEIVVQVAPSEAEKQKTKARLEEIRRQILTEGASFAELAKKYSDDIGSGRMGGDLGWQQRGAFVTEFEAAAFNLAPGEFSEIVETAFGYHLIQLIEKRGNSVHTKHILLRPEIQDEDIEKATAEVANIKSLIESDSITFNAAVKKYSDDKAPSYTNGGRMINPRTGDTFFETSQIEDPDVFLMIDSIEVGQVTVPYVQSDYASGAHQIRLIKLLSRTKPHQASLEQDFDKIKKAALEQNKQKAMEKWLEENISNTYIYMDEKYFGDCNLMERWQSLGSASKIRKT